MAKPTDKAAPAPVTQSGTARSRMPVEPPCAKPPTERAQRPLARRRSHIGQPTSGR